MFHSLERVIGFTLAAVFASTGAEYVQDTKPAAEKLALASVEKDISYADVGDEQKLDLYLPDKKNFTTVVFTYGGGWHSGSRKAVAPIGEKLQALGYGCALLSHRLSPKDKFPAQIEDVAAAFTWVKKHIADKGGNPDLVFLVGHSSGRISLYSWRPTPDILASTSSNQMLSRVSSG